MKKRLDSLDQGKHTPPSWSLPERQIVELFDASGVDGVVRTRDIIWLKTLELFSVLATSSLGAWGNSEVEREGLEETLIKYGFVFSDSPLHLR